MIGVEAKPIVKKAAIALVSELNKTGILSGEGAPFPFLLPDFILVVVGPKPPNSPLKNSEK